MTLLWKCLGKLYNPGVTLLFEQNLQSQKENARNQFLKPLRTRKTRILRRTRRRKKKMSPQEPLQGPPPDQRLRGNGGNRELPKAFTTFSIRQQLWLSLILFSLTHSCHSVSHFLSFYLKQRAHALSHWTLQFFLKKPALHLKWLLRITPGFSRFKVPVRWNAFSSCTDIYWASVAISDTILGPWVKAGHVYTEQSLRVVRPGQVQERRQAYPSPS